MTAPTREARTGHTPLPKMFIDPTRPGIIRWNDDPTMGILAGVKAPDIVQAVNSHEALSSTVDSLVTALNLAEKAWSNMLASKFGGTVEEQREPVLNAIRAALSQAAMRGEGGK